MGCLPSLPKGTRELMTQKQQFRSIKDTFETWEEVTEALRVAGLESCQLIVGVDFTKSNEWTGNASFKGKCLHAVDGPTNPYMTVLSLIARTLEDFDNDNLIPSYGFGDATSKADSVFSFKPGNQPAAGLQDMLVTYKRLVPTINLAGPTSFAPLIRHAMREVYNSGMDFTVLLIVADGQISPRCMQDTVAAIVDASSFPISIVMIGVGDGPWDTMANFDDSLPQRKWDNFQFVEFNKYFMDPSIEEKQKEASFAVNALMEISEQYKIAEFLMGKDAMSKVEHIIRCIPSSIVIDPPNWQDVPTV